MAIASGGNGRQAHRLLTMTDPDRYDFIDIGAGSAGCVLANRLSVDPDNKLFLLEAILAQDVMTMNPAALFTGCRHGRGQPPAPLRVCFSGARRSERAIMQGEYGEQVFRSVKKCIE